VSLCSYYTDLVPLPAGLSNQGGYTYVKQSTCLNKFGTPCPLSTDCTSVTSPTLRPLIETRAIGRFRFTGNRFALNALARALNNVAAQDQNLYNALGSSGMLCCRTIRGSSTSYSNHAWGFAVDFNVQGVLDPRGDAKAQRGLSLLYPYMHAQGFYWAAGYSGSSEDAMHFEIANEVVLNIADSGDWGTCTSTTGRAGRCIDASQCTGVTESGRCPGPTNIKCCYQNSGTPAPLKRYKCITADALNVRSGACTTYGAITTAYRGQYWEFIAGPTTACGYTWVQVRKDSFTGWVASQYTADCQPTGSLEVNMTITDEVINGTYFNEDGDNDINYEEIEANSANVFGPFFAFALALLSVVVF